ncbi:MAG: DNA replication/repair protein RecF, partial [Opitutales bacterium]
YHRALAERNSLLKGAAREASAGEDQLAAFEQILAPAAVELVAQRRTGLAEMDRRLAAAYTQLAAGSERAGLHYGVNADGGSVADWLELWRSHRKRDRQLRTTLCGPHRDDFDFLIQGDAARDFASEGQQRSLVIALRLAQAGWFQARTGVRPVLLADDVLGELDPDRRRRFWAAIDPATQIIATGTAAPDAMLGPWQVFAVTAGGFAETAGVGEASA